MGSEELGLNPHGSNSSGKYEDYTKLNRLGQNGIILLSAGDENQAADSNFDEKTDTRIRAQLFRNSVKIL